MQVSDRGWKRLFDDPIPLPRGRPLARLDEDGRSKPETGGLFSVGGWI